MFKPFRTQKEANRYAIAFVLSVVFLLLSEYMYPLGMGHEEYWHHHTIASYCYAMSNAPLIIITTCIAAKGLATWNIFWIKIVASLVIDWATTCMCYAFRNPSDFDCTETILIVVAIFISLIKFLLYRYLPHFRNKNIV